jgi:hypothetical protein
MKKLTLWIFLICIPAGAQILSQIFFQNAIPVISYCTVPGYPASPVATNLVYDFDADSISPCSASSVSTWADGSGNSHTATAAAGTITCNSNQLNGHNAVTATSNPKMTIAGSLPSSDVSAFIVFNPTTLAAGNAYALLGSTTTGNKLEYRINGDLLHQQILRQGSALILAGTTNISTATWYQVMTATDGVTTKMHINETVDGTLASNLNIDVANLLFSANGSEGFDGKVARILVYTDISTVNQLANECYLYGKYGR